MYSCNAYEEENSTNSNENLRFLQKREDIMR